MLAISDAVKEAWLSPSRQLAVRVKVDKTTYGSEDVSSLSFDSGSISGEVYQIGSTYMNSVTLSFPSIIETIKEDLEVIPELGILVDGEYHFSKLGHFYITEFNRDRNANVTTITANDKMIYLEGAYDSQLTYPKPYREVALEIANLAGVEVNQASFASLGIGAIKKPEGYTFRQAIGLIAQFEGGFASFNREGELEIRRLRPTEFGVTPESYLLKGFTKNENSYKIGGITVRIGEEETDVLKVGTTTGSQIELENKVMTQTLLNQMWELVKSINYFPFELKWRGCPPLEAGDWIYVTDRNGKRYSVPNLSYSMNFSGGLSAESKATTNSISGNATKYRGTLNQKVQWLESILSSNDWNHNYYDAEPENPKVGDLWFKKVGKDIEIWQYVETDGVQDWELQISSAPNQELLDMIEDLVKETAEAQAAAEEAKAAGEAAEQLAEEAKTESAKAIEDANAAIAGVTNLGQIVQAVDQAAQLAIEQSANAVTDAQAAMVKANELLTTVTELEGTITNITADIDAINGELSVKVDQTTFNQLKGTVDTHSTSISANAQAITQKANQTQVNAIDQTVISHTAELTTQADKIAGLVTKTDGQSTKISALELQAGQFNLTLSNVQSDLAGLEVGGRNYLPDSEAEWQTNSITSGSAYGVYRVGLDSIYAQLTDKQVQISFDVFIVNSVDTKTKIRVYGTNGVPQYILNAATIENIPTGQWIRVSVPVRITKHATNTGQARLEFFGEYNANTTLIKIRKIKLETGNKATDWSPAPEDMATVTALTSVQATVDGLITTVATKANQSQVTQMADQITSVVTDLSGLDTDSANYLAGTSDNNRVTTRNWDFNIVRPLIAGEYYTFSFYLRGSTPVNGLLVYLNDDTGQNRTGWQAVSATTINITTDLQYFVFKMKVTKAPSDATDGIRMSVYSRDNTTVVLTGNKAMLVKGLNDKTWSLPPEETASRSQITQLSDQINLRVTQSQVDASILANNQIKDTSNDNQPPSWYYTNYVRQTAKEFKTSSVIGLPASAGNFAYLETAVRWNDPSGGVLTQTAQANDGTYQRKAIADTGWTAWAKIADSSNVVSQINISTEGVLIAGEKVWISGLTKIDNAVIATAHIKDLAVTNGKIANLAVNTAKIGDAAIVTAKIGDLAVTNAKIANLAINDAKIQNASISSAKIISLDANKVSAATLSAITTNTGALNVSGWLTFSSSNMGLQGDYDYGETYGSLDPRWHIGEFKLASRTISFRADVYRVNSNDTKGSFLYYAESFLGSNYLKYREYDNKTNFNLKSRLDMTAGYFEMSNTFIYDPKISFKADGTGSILNLTIPNTLFVGRANAPSGFNTISFNSNRTDLADFNIGKDTSSVNGGRAVYSKAIYNRTYSLSTNVVVTGDGVLGRSTSAKKYKLDIQTASEVIAKSKNILKIKPTSWIDKAEYLNGKVATRYYGFIADDFDEAGLTEVVVYDKGEIESLSYDRISMYHNVILTEHEQEINKLKKKVEILENEIRVLQVA